MVDGSLIKPSFPRILRFALVLCSLVSWGLLLPAAKTLAAEGELGQAPASVSVSGEQNFKALPASASAPVIESESESGITEHGAMLEAEINPNGSEAEYELLLECGGVAVFQCGSVERVGSGRLPAGDSGQAVSVAVNNIPSGNRYKYWVVATSSEGAAKGAVRIFEPSEAWPGPVSETGTASTVTGREATLAGQIYPKAEESGEFEYFFEYGASTSYGASAPQPTLVRFGSCGMICEGEETGPKTVSVGLTELQPATTYHYRLVSTSIGGYRSFGGDATFTTGGVKAPPAISGTETPSITGASSTPSGPGESTLTSAKTATPKPLTKGQKLAIALRQCKQEPKRKRVTCEQRAKKKYATPSGDTSENASEQNRTRRR